MDSTLKIFVSTKLGLIQGTNFLGKKKTKKLSTILDVWYDGTIVRKWSANHFPEMSTSKFPVKCFLKIIFVEII